MDMNKNITYVVIGSDGLVKRRASTPESRLPTPNQGDKIVVFEDKRLPFAGAKFDLRKLRNDVNTLESFERGLTKTSKPVQLTPEMIFRKKVRRALESVDAQFAQAYKDIKGPMADIHAEKKRQAETGGGPLIASEEERQIVLTNAAAEDEQIATMERIRLETKARIREAKTLEELRLASKLTGGKI